MVKIKFEICQKNDEPQKRIPGLKPNSKKENQNKNKNREHQENYEPNYQQIIRKKMVFFFQMVKIIRQKLDI